MPASRPVRIGITGHFASGKTTFIRTISEAVTGITAVLTDYPDVSFDLGKLVTEDGLELHLYGNPSNFPPNILLQKGQSDFVGFVVMVKSYDDRGFRQAQSLVSILCSSDSYCLVVAANFQDHPAAKSPEDLRLAIQVPDDVPLLLCVATDKEAVKLVILSLLHRIRLKWTNDC
jgi:signal recognition particle receptor subunit beta